MATRFLRAACSQSASVVALGRCLRFYTAPSSSTEEAALRAKSKALKQEMIDVQCKIIDAREQRLPPPIDRLRERCKELKMENYESILKNASPHLTRLSIGWCSGVMTGRHSYFGWVNYYYVSYQWDEMRVSYASSIPGESGGNWGSIFLPDGLSEGALTTHAYFDCRNCDTDAIEKDFRPFHFDSVNCEKWNEKSAQMDPLRFVIADIPKVTTSCGVDLSKLGIKPYLLPLYLFQLQPDEHGISEFEDVVKIFQNLE